MSGAGTEGELGRVYGLQRSAGGVPKLSVERARVGRAGMEGDRQQNLRHHGGPERALCLYSLERIQALQREGHPIAAGFAGENVTIEGLAWERVVPGAWLRIGGVEVEVSSYTIPCRTIAESFRDGRFTRIGQKEYPGWSRVYVRVLREGEIAVGDEVSLCAAKHE